jgi:hypothetical protein
MTSSTLREYFPLHLLNPISRPPIYANPTSPSGATTLPAAYLPLRHGIIGRIRVVDPTSLSNPLTALAQVLNAKGFDTNVRVSANIPSCRNRVNRLTNVVDFSHDDETSTYDLFVRGYGEPASDLINTMGLPDVTYRQEGRRGQGHKPDIIAERTARRGSSGINPRVMQAEIKVSDKFRKDTFDAMVLEASTQHGLLILYDQQGIGSSIAGNNGVIAGRAVTQVSFSYLGFVS